MKVKKNKESVIKDIKKLAKRLNRVPTSDEFQKEYKYNPFYYGGKYSEMLIEAGFTPNIIVKDKEKILKQVKDLSEKLGKSPGPTEFKNEYGYIPFDYASYLKKLNLKLHVKKFNKKKLENSIKDYIKENGVYPPKKFVDTLATPTTIRRYYGTVRSFKKMFIEEKKEYNFNKDQLIKFLQEKIDSNELYSTKFFKENGNITLPFVLKRLECKNWEEVLELINRKKILKEKIEYEKEKIKKEYRELSEKLNLKTGATIQDLKKYLNYKINKLIFLFGGLRGLKNECGYDDNRSKARIDYIKLKADIKKLYSEKGKMKQIDLIKELKKRELASIDTVKTAFKVSSIVDLYDILDKKKRG